MTSLLRRAFRNAILLLGLVGAIALPEAGAEPPQIASNENEGRDKEKAS